MLQSTIRNFLWVMLLGMHASSQSAPTDYDGEWAIRLECTGPDGQQELEEASGLIENGEGRLGGSISGAKYTWDVFLKQEMVSLNGILTNNSQTKYTWKLDGSVSTDGSMKLKGKKYVLTGAWAGHSGRNQDCSSVGTLNKASALSLAAKKSVSSNNIKATEAVTSPVTIAKPTEAARVTSEEANVGADPILTTCADPKLTRGFC